MTVLILAVFVPLAGAAQTGLARPAGQTPAPPLTGPAQPIAKPAIGRAVPLPGSAPRANPAAPKRASAMAAPNVTTAPGLNPPNGTVSVPEGPSLAAHPVTARPVGPGSPTVTIPAGPTLATRVASQAADYLAASGIEGTAGGTPNLDAGQLEPVNAPSSILPFTRASRQQADQAAAHLPAQAFKILTTLENALQNGIPLLTYRYCAQSAQRAPSCTEPLPIGVPVLVDVTGDHIPDLLADVIPTVDIAGIVSASLKALNLQQEISALQKEITALQQLIAKPVWLLQHPGALQRLLDLRSLLNGLQPQLQSVEQILQSLVSVGLGMLAVRLPLDLHVTSPLPAQVWAEYDLPGNKVLSFGLDGYHRGDSLAWVSWEQFSVGLSQLADGVVDLRASLFQLLPGDSVAATAGVGDLSGSTETNPTIASMRISPVPLLFTGEVTVHSGARQADVDVTSSQRTKLDAITLMNQRPGTDRFLRAVIDQLPEHATATEQTPAAGETSVSYTGSSPIDAAQFHDYSYAATSAGTTEDLEQVTAADATALPTQLSAAVTRNSNGISLGYTANAAAAKTLAVRYYDQANQGLIVQGDIANLPRTLNLNADTASYHATLTTSSPIGSIAAIAQLSGGAISAPSGDHVTLITQSPAVGFSTRLAGLRGFDITYGAKPHVITHVQPGGQSFLAAASIEGTYLARVTVSNLPADIDATIDPAGRTLAYTASASVRDVRAAYAKVSTGPTVDISLAGLPRQVKATWELGGTTKLNLTDSASLDRAEVYYSPDYVTRVSSSSGHDIDATVTGLPARIALTVDMPDHSASWTASSTVTSIAAAVRVPLSGRNWVAAARISSVPAKWTAAFGGGSYSFHGLSGPIGSAWLAVTNHPGPEAPAGRHLAVHYDKNSGDLDASASIADISNVTYAPTSSGFHASFSSARDTLALDVSALLGGTRLAARGYLGPLPGTISLSESGGTVSYHASDSVNFTAQYWLGAAAALSGMGAPRYKDGISAVDGGCGGKGCAGSGPFCTGKGCFGITGIVDLTGLPASFTVNTKTETYSFSGYRPQTGSLNVYAGSTFLAGFPVRALATLSGVPSALNQFTIGPMRTGKGSLAVQYHSGNTTIGSLRVQAEGAVPGFGDSRALARLSPAPGSLTLSGVYGGSTDIGLKLSAPIDTLSLAVTGRYNGTPASGALNITNIPQSVTINSTAWETHSGLGAPGFFYHGRDGSGKPANTLSGSLNVDATLVKKTKSVTVSANAISLGFQKLAGNTSVRTNPDSSVTLTSDPAPTGEMHVGAGLAVSAVKPAPVHKDIATLSTAIPVVGKYLHVRVDGTAGVNASKIGQIGLALSNMRNVLFAPGKAQKDFPNGLRWLFPSIAGSYGTLQVSTRQVDLQPKVDLHLRVTKPLHAPDLYNDHLKLTSPLHSIEFRKYDDRLRDISSKLQGSSLGVPVLCLTLSTIPGYDGAQMNGITLAGSGGHQAVNFLDPGGKVPGYVLDLVEEQMSGFPDATIGHHIDPGRC